MKNKSILVIVLFVALSLLGAGYLLNLRYHIFKGHTLAKSQKEIGKDIYYCPMHPNFTSDKPGSCAICGMSLVKKVSQGPKPKTEEKKILYYRNPMNPEVTSPVPMKDSMGMDYIPVYEKDAASETTGIYISPERQQLIGAKKEKVEKRRLARQILTVGSIAYDPDLYVAQEEYLQALKTAEATRNSVLASVSTQSNSLVESAKSKLLLLGMSKEQIDELAKRGRPQENLYLPLDSDSVWVYIAIYEYEIGLIKEGLPVEIDVIAFPGEVFKGKIIAINPVLNPMTRSIQVRAEIDNPEHKLKPDMFVNVRINIDLGEKLAVPEEAVLNTGTRTLAVVTSGSGDFYSKEVKLGQKAQGYYEVLEGLQDGDTVVTSGNFLIDSESRLQSAISSEHKHGQ